METAKRLPATPGIYLFKDSANEIIYIGKAKSLRDRVSSYFNKNKKNWKIESLMTEVQGLDYIATSTEADALILEAQLIQQHQPKYNVLLKSGQPFLYILFTKDEIPEIKLVRNTKEKGTYFGPFIHKMKTRSVFNYLMSTFKLKQCNKKIANGCLDYHLNLCAGSCKNDFDMTDYCIRIQLAIDALNSNRDSFMAQLEQAIQEHNKQHAYEKSQRLHTYREHIDTIFDTIRVKYNLAKLEHAIAAATSPRQFIASTSANISTELQQLLNLKKPINSIDCFDISHFQSSYIVGSCVRWKDGTFEKNSLRRFRIKTLIQQDDYAALREIVARRYKKDSNPDLILIDGGIGQRNAVKELFPQAHFASLAKREERLFSDAHPQGIVLDLQADTGKLLIASRDYAHHFAISYHKKRRHTTKN